MLVPYRWNKNVWKRTGNKSPPPPCAIIRLVVSGYFPPDLCVTDSLSGPDLEDSSWPSLLPLSDVDLPAGRSGLCHGGRNLTYLTINKSFKLYIFLGNRLLCPHYRPYVSWSEEGKQIHSLTSPGGWLQLWLIWFENEPWVFYFGKTLHYNYFVLNLSNIYCTGVLSHM